MFIFYYLYRLLFLAINYFIYLICHAKLFKIKNYFLLRYQYSLHYIIFLTNIGMLPHHYLSYNMISVYYYY